MSWYVSPGGNDGAPGSLTAPFRTLARAVDAARAGGDKEVLLFGGNYENTRVTLDACDSGLTVGRAGDGEPCLLGGVALGGWEPDGECWVLSLPREAPEMIRMLEIDGRTASRARLPGFLRHKSTFASKWMSTSAGGWDVQPTQAELTELVYDPGGLPEGFSGWDCAELTVFHKWDETLTGVAAHDPAKRLLTLSVPCGHPPGGFGADKYIVWNTRDGMEPGCFRHDTAARRIVYRPTPGQDMRRAEALIPLGHTVLDIRGPVRGLTVRDIAIRCASTPAAPGGFGAAGIPGAVDCVGDMTDCVFQNLSIQNVGGWGVRLRGANTNVTVRGCRLSNTGAGGILLENGSGCLIRNNRIERAGRVYPSAIGIIAQGCDILSNTLRDLPYTGICYSGKRGGEIARNRVTDAVNVLNDGAGIYVTFSENGVLRNNTVEDIPQSCEPDSTRNGLYLDEQCAGWLVEGNRTLNCSSAMMNHMARDNTLRRNVFTAHTGDLLVSLIRCEAYRLEDNTFHSGGTVTLAGGKGAVSAFSGNVLYGGEGGLRQVCVGDDYSRAPVAAPDWERPLYTKQ